MIPLCQLALGLVLAPGRPHSLRRHQRVTLALEEDGDNRGSAVPPRSVDRSDFDELTDLKMRFEGGLKLSDGLKRGGLSKSIRVGHYAVARKDLPSLQIVGSQSYVIQSVYYQGVDDSTAEVCRVAVDSLDARCATATPRSLPASSERSRRACVCAGRPLAARVGRCTARCTRPSTTRRQSSYDRGRRGWCRCERRSSIASESRCPSWASGSPYVSRSQRTGS